ncbi:hypothetical protein VNI00_001010 [Paramarasmius palmivorus]|uniref:Uncharacterized protein n=1 Tax=Paramarasmius palmivorus TaxID=297713 RepID=A0AAW0E5U5_9AGAR
MQLTTLFTVIIAALVSTSVAAPLQRRQLGLDKLKDLVGGGGADKVGDLVDGAEVQANKAVDNIVNAAPDVGGADLVDSAEVKANKLVDNLVNAAPDGVAKILPI